MNPKELKYTKEHEWLKIDGDTATVGVTDHAQELLTDVVFVELPEVGKVIEKDGNFGVVESVKSVSDMFCPISGEVTEVNEDLEDAPELINKEPYVGGWIAKLKIKNPSEIEGLMTSEEYEKLISEEK